MKRALDQASEPLGMALAGLLQQAVTLVVPPLHTLPPPHVMPGRVSPHAGNRASVRGAHGNTDKGATPVFSKVGV